MAFTARRNVPMWALFVIFSMFDSFYDNLLKLEKRIVTAYFYIFAISAVFLTSIFVQLPKTHALNSSWEIYCKNGLREMPCNAVEYIKNKKIEKLNIFSHYEWGGFLEWRSPENKYFVDGRMPAWPTADGKSPYTTHLEILQTAKDFNEKLLNTNTDMLLIKDGTYLDLELQSNKQYWGEVYRDNLAVIYVQNMLK